MKPDPALLHQALPEVPEALITAHLSRLTEEYFGAFSFETVCAHLRALARLCPENCVEVLAGEFEDETGEGIELTVLAFDSRGVFSLITGVLAACGFSIRSGDIFTYRPAPAPSRRSAKARRNAQEAELLRRRRIIDRFAGVLQAGKDPQAFPAEVRRCLAEVLGLLEQGGRDRASKAKHLVNELVAEKLRGMQLPQRRILYPLEISVDNDRGPFTTLRVQGQDTPAFLYALSAALDLQGIVIEHVRIRTSGVRIEDELDVLTQRGEKLTKEDARARLTLTVLLTKQFTYFLPGAPNPYAALCRFEQLTEEVLALPEGGRWVELLSSPLALRNLARLLGTSDYIWEDMIRQQYESLLPLLQRHVRSRRFAPPGGEIEKKLWEALKGCRDLGEAEKSINEFKDRQIFLIDLDHILQERFRVTELAAALTALAEGVVRAAVKYVYEDLAARHGEPLTVGGLPARYAVFGLGKLGGAALGYASDIELLFVYSDSGATAGPESIPNQEFYERLVRGVRKCIRAKREGVFHVDLRLRPYGDSGPLACSLSTFCDYYRPGGKAHAFERLALVRLRYVGGDREFGTRVERLRDHFIYDLGGIEGDALRELREKQLAEKVPPGSLNAKFSPGALVDLEYDVQLLQVAYGRTYRALRTPLLHEALRVLAEVGVLQEEEARVLTEAYFFLRRLINALRMLRGSARDLFLPPRGSDEYLHLARRMGYSGREGLSPDKQLEVDFETRTAQVRAFVERHFGRTFLPGPSEGSIADVVLSEGMARESREGILRKAGFTNTQRAFTNMRNLAGTGSRVELFAPLAVLACDYLRRVPDPDMALNNWDRFVKAHPDPLRHFQLLFDQPRRLEILLGLFAGSQFLADTLIKDVDFFTWLTDPAVIEGPRGRGLLEAELSGRCAEGTDRAAYLRELRRFRRREFLRIGTRDLCLGAPLERTTADLTAVAEAVIEVALRRVWERVRERGKTVGWEAPQEDFCVLAFGKLGGQELNYSSDVDLLGVCRTLGGDHAQGAAIRRVFDEVMEELRSDLSSHTPEGHAYRVDLRLRPYGRAGHLVPRVEGVQRYYEKEAALWEVQALLKLRPVAGNRQLGEEVCEALRPLLLAKRAPCEVVDTIRSMRAQSSGNAAALRNGRVDVKNGAGGLRDIEFLVQGLQLLNAWRSPEILTGNTLCGLSRLGAAGYLDPGAASELARDYCFLRRVEHALQILEDRQTHVVPEAGPARSALSKRVLGPDATEEALMEKLRECQKRVERAVAAYLRES